MTFIAGAVRDFNPEDFLGIPDDQAFALFEATFFGAPPPVVAFEGGLEGGTPPPFFDPAFFDQQLDQFEGQLVGFLGAMGPEHFDEIDDGQLVDIFGRIDFNDPDFDRTVLGGEDLGGIFGSLDHESLAALSPGQIMGAIGGLNSSDFQGWDPSAAFNVFENINFDESREWNTWAGWSAPWARTSSKTSRAISWSACSTPSPLAAPDSILLHPAWTRQTSPA